MRTWRVRFLLWIHRTSDSRLRCWWWPERYSQPRPTRRCGCFDVIEQTGCPPPPEGVGWDQSQAIHAGMCGKHGIKYLTWLQDPNHVPVLYL